ncbi:MAG: thioredoxin family protein [Helicobacter sp.]|nr:thioredoxin family protein [Helicobacter sp.]
MKLKRLVLIFFSVLFLVGCEGNVDSTIISQGTTNTKEQLNAINSVDKHSYAEVADIFLDTEIIKTQNKPYFIVFGANGCFYCDRLKEVIKEDLAIKEILKNNFSSYYINLSYSKNHEIDFLNTNLSTAEFARRYNVRVTPTLVFITPDGKDLFVYSGYIPRDRFAATLEFLQEPNTSNLNQKEIITTLQNLFQQKGI